MILISNKIKDIMKSKKISQEELANKIGMTKNGLNNNLTANDFKISVLEKIAKSLGVPVSYFFDEVGPVGDKILQINKNGINVNNGTVTLADCTHQLELMKKDIEGLKKEIELKDKIIEMLEKNK